MPDEDARERYPMSAMDPSDTVTTADGMDIAVYDLGGAGPPLLLVHPTGFCGPVLGPIAAALTSEFRCVLIDLRAHGRSSRPPDGDLRWDGFATDVLAVVDQLGLEELAGFGHSCGGAALMLAEERRPGTFSRLYLFEPIVLPAGGGQTNPLAEGARRRRSRFASRDEALANFASKAPLNVLRADVLAAYVDNGFAPDPDGGLRVRCTPEDEAEVFVQSLTHSAYGDMDRVACPVVLACGADTDAIDAQYLRHLARRLGQATTLVLDTMGHFGPLQDPPRVGATVRETLRGS